jgi:hypothetical protein
MDRAHLRHERLQPGDETVVPGLDPDDERPEHDGRTDDVLDRRKTVFATRES